MSMLHYCPQGHAWSSTARDGSSTESSDTVCPLCGAEALTVNQDTAALSEAATQDRQLAAPEVRDLPSIEGYEILAELGRGGMGVVYKARQNLLNRLVALKVIRAGEHASPRELARFRAEAEAVARLQHPHIVQIYEIGEWHGSSAGPPLPFFSMEFVEGGSLARRLAGAPRPPREAAQLLETLAQAIHTAHQQGIVHRDLKPANVLLRIPDTSWSPQSLTFKLSSAIPKITDFGLAKRLEQDLSADGQTRTGAVVGTPSYMAPEQAAGRRHEVSPAVDIYALGAILYELLTGRPPFRAASPLETVLQVLDNEPVPPRQLQPNAPHDLETITLKCLQKDPRKRYPIAKELAADLRRFLDGEPIHARPVGRGERAWRWCRRKPLAASLLTALILVFVLGSAGMGWQWWRAAKLNRLKESLLERALAQRDESRVQRKRAEANFRMARAAVDQYLTLVSEEKLLYQSGLQPLRKDLLITARQFYEEFAQQAADDPSVRAELGEALARLGQLAKEIDEKSKAIDPLQRAVHVFASLKDEEPNEPQHLASLGNARNELAGAYLALSRTDEAVATYLDALAAWDELVQLQPAKRMYRFNQAVVLTNLGTLEAEHGELNKAEESHKRALAIREQLLKDDPTNPRYQHGLAQDWNNLGSLYIFSGQGELAEAAFRKSLDIAEPLTKEHTRIPEYHYALITAFNNLGSILNRKETWQDAETQLRRGLAVAEPLAEKNPAVVDYRKILGDLYGNLGTSYRIAGKPADAQALSAKALAVREQLVRDFPGIASIEVSLGGNYCNLGLMLADQRSFEAALERYAKARTVLEAVLKREPRHRVAREFLFNTFGAQGQALSELRRVEEAAWSWEAAWRLATEDGRRSLAFHLTAACCDTGTARLRIDQLEDALDWYSKAARYSESLIQLVPDHPQGRNLRASCLMGLGESQRRLGRFEDALQSFDKAVALDPGPLRLRLMSGRGLILAEIRRYAEAFKVAEALSQEPPQSIEVALGPAAILSTCLSALAKDAALSPADRERHIHAAVAAAITSLKKAQQAGLFKKPERIHQLQERSELAALRERIEFQELIAELSKQKDH